MKPPTPEVRGEDPGMPFAKALLVVVGIYAAWWLIKGRKNDLR
jgi:hypothetical protein